MELVSMLGRVSICGLAGCWLTLLGSGLLLGCQPGPPAVKSSIETGQVRWSGDLDHALRQAAHTGKPVLVLFQEIPGCQTCQGFGRGPLSDPLLVEAMESEFHPVLVHNNRPGRDAQILQRFGEPAWNNPVIRYLDAQGKDWIPRRDGIWTLGETAQRMVDALRAADRPVPRYLELAAQDPGECATRQASFAMHCYWEGEVRLGELEGAVGTRSQWVGAREVVTVDYLPERISYRSLVEAAREIQCAGQVFARDAGELEIARQVVGVRAVPLAEAEWLRDAKVSDQKYYLAQTSYLHLPMIEPQAVKINAALARQQDPRQWLSPRQRRWLQRIEQATPAQQEKLKTFRYPYRRQELAEAMAALEAVWSPPQQPAEDPG